MRRYIFAPLHVLREIIKLFIIYMPGAFGFRLRYLYYKSRFKSIGTNVKIDVGVLIDGAEHVTVGNNVYIDKYCVIATGNRLVGKITRKINPEFSWDQGEIIIQDDIHIAQFCVLMGYGGIFIGSKSVMSAGSKIYSLTNTSIDLSDPGRVISIQPYENAPFLLSPVMLAENVWLGLNVVVMPSVSIGRDSFCVSNSLVLKSYPENSHLAGQPALLIRKRFDFVV